VSELTLSVTHCRPYLKGLSYSWQLLEPISVFLSPRTSIFSGSRKQFFCFQKIQ
jgi:hypothetical protein